MRQPLPASYLKWTISILGLPSKMDEVTLFFEWKGMSMFEQSHSQTLKIRHNQTVGFQPVEFGHRRPRRIRRRRNYPKAKARFASDHAVHRLRALFPILT